METCRLSFPRLECYFITSSNFINHSRFIYIEEKDNLLFALTVGGQYMEKCLDKLVGVTTFNAGKLVL